MSEKYVLVTGAAGGIGRCAVRQLAQAGYKVFAGVLNEAEAKIVAGDAVPGAIPLTLDVSREESVDAAVRRMEEQLPAGAMLAGLVNNAGVNINAPLQYLSTKEIRMQIEVNLLGPLLLTRAALPLLRRTPGARVLFTGSAMGLMATPTISAYCATKFGLEGASDSLRVELGVLGIHVALIEPGVVRTPMTSNAPGILAQMLSRMSADDRACYEAMMKKIVDMSAGPKAGVAPEQVAAAIVDAMTAASPRARYAVGSDSQALTWLRHLPSGARDFMQRKMFGV